jgi:phospholipid/cholesterol/gamma-HCH transport system substrate-binding protein
MTIFLEVFRLNKAQYHYYIACFKDISGLEKKAEVKIAGVKVGWVETISLMSEGPYQATASIAVHKNYIIRIDARVVIRQNGVLGSKYLEIMPGDPQLPPLDPGSLLCKPGSASASVDEILSKFSAVSDTIDRTLLRNEQAITDLISNFKDLVSDIKESLPGIKDHIEKTALHARDGLMHINSVVEKVNNGKGMIGKLINEEETYRDLKVTAQGLRSYFDKVNALNIVFDSHSEYMYRPAEHVNFEDAKGYLDMRIHPSDDYFYLLQGVMSQKGNITRSIKEVKWFDERCVEFLPRELVNEGVAIPELVGKIEKRKRKLDQLKIGLQVGKIYKNIAFRVGIFENSAGFGIDFDIPCNTDKLRWVTSFEAFDFRGRDRFDDKRPHLKWINRVFLLRNVYIVAGADDFISKENANGFFGGGIRFCDDDIKYFLSQLNIGGFY